MNLPYPIYSKYNFGDMTVLFMKSQDRLIFSMIPAGTEEMIPVHRHDLNDTVGYRSNRTATGNSSDVVQPESMMQLHVMGDPFAYTPTMREGKSSQLQKFVSQEQKGNKILTTFCDDRSLEMVQTLEYRANERFVSVSTSITNKGTAPVELGMIESAVLGMISPFHADHAPDALKIHRYRTCWSGEARELIEDPDDLALLVPWNGNSPAGLRFGQRGSMVASEWMPTVGIYDAEANVSWAMQLASVQPWQICISRMGDFLTLSGGPVDFDFTNWRRTLAPGETYTTFPAVISCVCGSMEDALQRTSEYAIARTEFPMPPQEKDMPVIYNEFLTTWGAPTEAALLPVIEQIKKIGCRYFVIDGGWGRNDKTRLPGIGDWIPHPSIYPHGFEFLLDKIREAGMIPGIWFEFECSSADCELYKNHPDWFVTFEGKEYPLNIDRHFLDLRKKEVIAYLDERVIGFLKKYRFGYMKVDYNAKIHLADCAHGSAAEGVAELLEAARRFYAKIRRALPELVLEICSSGGMRLTSGWMAMASMASFSDCHEAEAIPLIAADVAKQIPYRMNQIWCALRKGESAVRTNYLLAGGFLGRICLSGDGQAFSPYQIDAAQRAVKLYREAFDILEYGHSKTERQLTSKNCYFPKGYQLFRRSSGHGELLVLHVFENGPAELSIPVRFTKIAGVLQCEEKVELSNGILKISGLVPMSGLVVVLR